MNMGAANSSTWIQVFPDESRYYCYDADFSMQVSSNFGGALLSFGWGGLEIPDTGMPKGLWTFKVGGVEKAWFDLEVASPVSTSGIITATPIPGLRFNSNSTTGEITGVEVTWFQYNPGSAQYTPLSAAQIAVLDALVYESNISIGDDDGPDPLNPESVPLYIGGAPEPTSTSLHDGSTIVFPPGTWYMPGSAGDITGNLVPTRASVGTHISGVSYTFGWSQ